MSHHGAYRHDLSHKPGGHAPDHLRHYSAFNGPIAFASPVSRAALLSSSFRKDEEFFRIGRVAQILSYLMLVFFVLTVVSVATRSGFTGLSQRVVLGLFVIWFLLIAARLLRTGKHVVV
jgi:FtsH-binding integral membrane protein